MREHCPTSLAAVACVLLTVALIAGAPPPRACAGCDDASDRDAWERLADPDRQRVIANASLLDKLSALGIRGRRIEQLGAAAGVQCGLDADRCTSLWNHELCICVCL